MENTSVTARTIPIVPASFWEHFIAVSNNKSHPVVIRKGAMAEQLLTLEDGFQLAKNIVRSRELTVNADGKMLDHAAIPEFPEHFSGFEQFVRDFAAINNAEGITFTRDYCLKHSNTVAMKLRAFTHGYIERYGIPFPGANSVFIGGRYKSTWIGLHNDSCDTFLFPLYGKKRMMIWRPEYFDAMALEKKSALNGVCFGHIDIGPYAKDAVIHEVSAGEILFIPAGWWHYNKLEDLETTLTLSVGMFSHGTAQEFCKNPMKASIASKAANASLGTIPQLSTRVFQSLSGIELPQQAAQFIDSIRDNCKLQMLLKLSANGIIRDRATEGGSASVSLDTPIAGRPDSPLFLIALDGDSGLLFAAGEMIRVSNFRQVHNLVTRLQTGAPFNPHTLVDEAEQEHEFLELLQWLNACAAVDVLRHESACS